MLQIALSSASPNGRIAQTGQVDAGHKRRWAPQNVRTTGLQLKAKRLDTKGRAGK
jgi:hypothetical protein